MKRIALLLAAVVVLAGVVAYMVPASGQADGGAAPIFAVKIPRGYRDWRFISVAREEGSLDDIAGDEHVLRRDKAGRRRPGWIRPMDRT